MSRKILLDIDGLFSSGTLWHENGERGVLFYLSLMGIAEHWGGFQPEPVDLAYQTGALRATPEEIMGFLESFRKHKKVAFFERDGKVVGIIKAYLRHSKHSHPAKNSLPLPDGVTFKKKGGYIVQWDVLEVFLESSGIIPECIRNIPPKEVKE